MKKNNSISVFSLVLLAFAGGFLGGLVGVTFLNSGLAANVPNSLVVTEQKVYVEESQLIEVIREVSPSVVSVIGTQTDAEGNLLGKGEGTGFIVSAEGLIITNKHVVLNEAALYKIVLNNGVEYSVEVVSRDPFDDVAVLKIVGIENLNLPIVKFGDSDRIEVGQKVISIGNALAIYENTVTSGIVSAKGRNVSAYNDAVARAENLSGLIQTDAAINRGNSGGPLINLNGEVIGINVAVAEANGIGFAIPVNDLKPILRSIDKYGEIVRPVLGARFIMLSEMEAKKLTGGASGALVVGGSFVSEPAVIPGGAADLAGLKDMDVILRVNDKILNLDNPLHKVIREYEPGAKVVLKIWRAGEIFDLSVVLGSSKSL